MKFMEPKPERYIALYDTDLELGWTLGELDDFREMWRAGIHIVDMAKKLKRHIDELAILVIDLMHNEMIEERPNGVFGEVG